MGREADREAERARLVTLLAHAPVALAFRSEVVAVGEGGGVENDDAMVVRIGDVEARAVAREREPHLRTTARGGWRGEM